MTDHEFVSTLRKEVLNNYELYENMLSTPIEQAQDEYWRRLLLMYSQVSEEQRSVMISIFRQVIIDTSSTILGILDGTSGDQKKEFRLTYGDSEQLNGYLQDIFLADEQSDKQ